ncbi:hypothetical protein [Endozoicomonas atrinae]|uniref:hypothetical protein n=1 Tax=Endozoicomonas atrinae TaxID=1333660 RepID=UPI003B0072D7
MIDFTQCEIAGRYVSERPENQQQYKITMLFKLVMIFSLLLTREVTQQGVLISVSLLFMIKTLAILHQAIFPPT